MSEYFKNLNVNLAIDKRKVGYGDFRDWFIIEESRPIYETELQLFINDEQVHKSFFPINTKEIICKINGSVTQNVYVESMRWDVPEMGITRTTIFDKPTNVAIEDTLNIDLTIEINTGE